MAKLILAIVLVISISSLQFAATGEEEGCQKPPLKPLEFGIIGPMVVCGRIVIGIVYIQLSVRICKQFMNHD